MIGRQQKRRFLHHEHVFHPLRRRRIDRPQCEHLVGPGPKLRLRLEVRHLLEPRGRFRRRTAEHEPIHARQLHFQNLHPPRQIAGRRFHQRDRLLGLGRFDRIMVRIVQVQMVEHRRIVDGLGQRGDSLAAGTGNRQPQRVSKRYSSSWSPFLCNKRRQPGPRFIRMIRIGRGEHHRRRDLAAGPAG